MSRIQSFWRWTPLTNAVRAKILPCFYLATLILTVTANSPLSAATTSLVGYWPFYEGAGTTATDLSGKENTGRLVNEPTWGAGKFGYGLSFNGTDQYVEIAHSDSLSLAKQLTVSAWIFNKAAANSLLSDPEFHIIAAKGWAPDAGGSWTLAWDKKSNDLSFCVRKESDKGYSCVFSSYDTLATDWHHIIAVFNSGRISLYVDGSLAAGLTDLRATRIHNNTEAVRIGAVVQNASSFLQNWDGDIDEVQIHNQALTDAEIKALFQATGYEKSAGSSRTSLTAVSQTSSTTSSSGSSKSTVATPVITPNGGSYAGPVNITLMTSTPGASIYYTTDGTSPTQSSQLYKTSFTVAATTLVKAKAFKQSSNPSSETGAWFTMDQPFDFSLSNTGDKAAKRGSSAQNAVSAALKSGSGKPISFSVSGLPSGVSSSFSTVSCGPSCSSTLTVITSSSTSTGTFPIAVTGSGGGISRSTSFNLTVSDPVTFDFTLSNSGNKSVTAGSSVSNTISATLASGSTQSVAFSASGLPAGATASFSPGSCNPTCSSTLTIATTLGVTPAGTSTIMVSASGGGITRITTFSLTVNLPIAATPTITPNGGNFTGSISVTMTTVTPGASIYFTTDGSTPTQSSKLYTGAMTLTNSTTVKAVTLKAGYNSSGMASTSFTIIQPFDFSLTHTGNQSVMAGSSTTNSITATLVSGSTQAVTFSVSGLPSGATASFSSTSCSPTCSSTLTLNASSATAGTYSIMVTATGGGVTRTTGFNLTVSSATASVSVNKTSYTSGETITVTVNGGDSNVQGWIALYAVSNPDSAWSFEGNWQYLNGQQIAPTIPVPYPVTLRLTAPSTSGTYNIRYFAYNGYSNRLATSQSFVVTAPSATASVSVNKTSYSSGETITATVNGGNSNVQEWVALYAASNPDSAWSFEGNWQYLNGQQTAPTIPVSYPATLSFTAPSTSGTYNLRYFAYNGYSNRLATSQSFTVTAPTVAVAAPTMTPNGGSYANSVSVTIQTATQGASIYHTTDGSTPSQSSTLYTGPLTLTNAATVKAKAFKSGYNTSAEASVSFTVVGSCNYYASPFGGGDGLSASSPFQIADFWPVAGPGKTLCLLDGVYADSRSNIYPARTGLSGTSSAPITIRALNDGKVRIDGQNSRYPVLLLGNSYFVIQGINAHNSSGTVVDVAGGSSSNIIRRVVAWDARDENYEVFGIHNSTGNLLEDVAGFGVARKIFSFSQNGNNNICRRCWGRWEGSTNVGPKDTFELVYNNAGNTYENIVGTWDNGSMPQSYVLQNNGSVWTGNGAGTYTNGDSNQPYSVIGEADPAVADARLKIWGALAYVKSGIKYQPPGVYYMHGGGGVNITDAVSLLQNRTDIPNFYLLSNGPLSNLASYGGAADVVSGTTVRHSNPFQGGTCYQYQNQQLTNIPLWPWPMNQRILDATTVAASSSHQHYIYQGSSPSLTLINDPHAVVDVTAEVEQVFGSIPAGCKGAYNN